MNPRGAAGHLPDSMITIPVGSFLMGSEAHGARGDDGEGPVRRVRVSSHQIDAYAVSNAQFAEFVAATGHVTDAERFGWSFVFGDHVHPAASADVINGVVPGAEWWRGVRGASWRYPAGRGSAIDDILDHPVVYVSFSDASGYAAWAGGRQPTEAEWERAARGGLEQATFPWGDELMPAGEHRANIWQGSFPDHNTAAGGYSATAPVTSYHPNGFGLYNTSGNVWEWPADWYSPDWHAADEPATRIDPQGRRKGPAASTGVAPSSATSRTAVDTEWQPEPTTLRIPPSATPGFASPPDVEDADDVEAA
jgi:formylglycine-generating enzyme required for sulfatase activity